MKNIWKWVLGFLLIWPVLIISTFIWRTTTLPYKMYEIMGYGWQMPMMYGGYGMMGFGMLFFWIISLALLVFIGLGIVWLVKELTAQK